MSIATYGLGLSGLTSAGDTFVFVGDGKVIPRGVQPVAVKSATSTGIIAVDGSGGKVSKLDDITRAVSPNGVRIVVKKG